MIPVDMATENDCMRACVASLLGLRLADVPDFGDDDDQEWAVREWLTREHGLYTVYLNAESRGQWASFGWHMACGKAVGGCEHHAVVAYNGVVVHDPHPDRLGLASIDTYILLVPMVPMRCVVADGGES